MDEWILHAHIHADNDVVGLRELYAAQHSVCDGMRRVRQSKAWNVGMPAVLAYQYSISKEMRCV